MSDLDRPDFEGARGYFPLPSVRPAEAALERVRALAAELRAAGTVPVLSAIVAARIEQALRGR
jgi:hypothetical protein